MRSSTVTTIALTALGAITLAACSVSTTGSDSQTTAHEDRPVDLLHERGRAATAIAAIEKQVGASPAQSTDILLYPEYMDVKAQDPTIPEHIDEYEWRDGSVSGPEPVHLSGPQADTDASLFPTSAVRWRDLPDDRQQGGGAGPRRSTDTHRGREGVVRDRRALDLVGRRWPRRRSPSTSTGRVAVVGPS